MKAAAKFTIMAYFMILASLPIRNIRDEGPRRPLPWLAEARHPRSVFVYRWRPTPELVGDSPVRDALRDKDTKRA